MPEQFDLGTLGTQAGAAAAVGLIVQFTKPLFSKLPDWTIRLYTLVLSWAVVYVYLAVTGGLNAAAAFVAFFNGILVAILAMGGYELVSNPLNRKG